MASMVSLKCEATSFLFTFKETVSMPFSGVKSSGRITNFLMDSALDTDLFALSTALCTSLFITGFSLASFKSLQG